MATPRMALPLPLETDTPDGPTQMAAIANRIDTVAAMYDQGTLAARPAPGIAGRSYWAIDQGRAGQLFYDNGTVWAAVEPVVPSGRIVPNPAVGVAVSARQEIVWPGYDQATGGFAPAIQSGVRIVPGAGVWLWSMVWSWVDAGPDSWLSVYRKPAGAPIGDSPAGGMTIAAIAYMQNRVTGSASGIVSLGANDGIELFMEHNYGVGIALTNATTPTYPTELRMARLA